MLPIAILPLAGILLGIGASFSNPNTVRILNLGWLIGGNNIVTYILNLMSEVGSVVFVNLPVIFAVGVAIGMAKHEKATAALSSLVAFLTMHKSISALLKVSSQMSLEEQSKALASGNFSYVCGIYSLNMGVFGGIIVGLVVGALHNKFYKIKFSNIFSFFGGIRFVPIISSAVSIFLGVFFFFTWPYVQRIMLSLCTIVSETGYVGTFFYGVIERALIPFGLHHVFYMPFWQTALGGTAIIDGAMVSGAQNIFFAELASPNTVKFSVGATKFMTGKFPFMIFGLPGAALAMYSLSKPSKKHSIGGLLLSAALTSMLTGITEPLEFTFLFVAPVLYGVHCTLAGISFMLMHIFKIAIGMTFSGGIIDLVLFGVIQGNDRTNWVAILPIGAAYFIIYYVVFRFIIKRFNLITPGREEDEVKSKLYTRKDYENSRDTVPVLIVTGLGGAQNIEDIDCCATRLRVQVRDRTKVDEKILKDSGASGIIKKGSSIQVVYGPQVTIIKSEVEEYLRQIKIY
jgi:PTS system D-glucosamine-specific IIC component